MFSHPRQQEAGERTRIQELLKSILEEFQNECVKQAKADITQCIIELEANNMDISKFSGAKYQFIRKFVTRGTMYSSGTIQVEVNDALVKKVEQSAKWRAVSDFKRFAEKIENKIYEKLPGCVIASLTLEGDIWSHSQLIVTTSSGEKIRFVTKTIVNQTYAGHRFLQFPTRVL